MTDWRLNGSKTPVFIRRLRWGAVEDKVSSFILLLKKEEEERKKPWRLVEFPNLVLVQVRFYFYW